MPTENVGNFNSANQGYLKNSPVESLTGPDVLSTGLANILSNVISFLTLIAGIAFIFWFVIGATSWITSAGDATKAKKASQQITNAIIGLIITAAAIPILSVIGDMVGIPITNPATLINSLVFNP